jgi:hypothetical protein
MELDAMLRFAIFDNFIRLTPPSADAKIIFLLQQRTNVAQTSVLFNFIFTCSSLHRLFLNSVKEEKYVQRTRLSYSPVIYGTNGINL